MSWWALRLRFQATYRAVVEKMPFEPDQIISIDPKLPELTQLVTELSQPTYDVNTVGKILINKTPDGTASPNRADAVMIAYAIRGGAYFAPPRAVDTANAPVKAHPMPTRMDYAFAVMSFVEDAVAVVFCAANQANSDGSRGPGFYILDWDLRHLDAEAEIWMSAVAHRLEELRDRACGRASQPLQVFCDSFDEGYAELMRQWGFPAVSIGDQLPPVAERFNKARPYANVGLVSFAQPAHERLVTFRGSTRNFLRELASKSEVTESNPLAIAFATAVLIVYKDRPALALPSRQTVTARAAPQMAMPAAAPPVPTVPLRPGRHVINGVVVEVPAEGDKDWGAYPMPVGNHIVDEKIVNVQRPGSGIRLW